MTATSTRRVVYGPAYTPPRPLPRRRPQPVLRVLDTRTRSEFLDACDRYRDVMLHRQLARGMRDLLRSLPPEPAARLLWLAGVCAGQMDPQLAVERLVPVEDEKGQWAVASKVKTQ